MRHRTLVAGIGALTLTFALVVPATAATSSPTTIGALQAALADCATAPNVITIAADIVSPQADLDISCDTTIDLGVYDVTVLAVHIAVGHELEITGPVDGTEGTLTADASGQPERAGIRTTDATLRVTGGAIEATGGVLDAGIGGSSVGGSAGTVIVEGGTVTATSGARYGAAIGGVQGGFFAAGDAGVLTISGGLVTAQSSTGSGAIVSGGGFDAAGPIVTVTGGTLVASSTGETARTIGGGENPHSSVSNAAGSLTIGLAGTVILSSADATDAGVFGSGYPGGTAGAAGTLVVEGTLRVVEGGLNIEAETSATIASTGRILGSVATPATGASIIGPGTISNSGVIALAPTGPQVNVNNRLLTFSDGVPSMRVYGPTLDEAYRTLPAPPAGTAWNTSADGSGTWVDGTFDTAGEGTTALVAAGPATITVPDDPAALTTVAGEAYTFPVTVRDSVGDPLVPQPLVTFDSDDCTFTGLAVFETAGVCTITATAPDWGPFPVTSEFDVTVEAAAAVSIGISPAASTIDAGSPASFTVTGLDAFGNAASTTGATLTSSNPDDVISGLTVTPTTLGDRAISATLGMLGTPTPATLTAVMPSLTWNAPDLEATAGVPVALDAVIQDAEGDPLVPQPTITYTSTCAFTGLAVFTVAGVCPVTASATVYGQPVSTTFDVTVAAAAAAELTLTPSATSVAQGGTLSFAVTGVDEFGNAASTTDAVLTSSVATDVIDGLTVRFPHASPHTITATLGDAADSVTIEVVPTPALASTGSGVLMLPVGMLALALLALGALAIAARRPMAKG